MREIIFDYVLPALAAIGLCFMLVMGIVHLPQHATNKQVYSCVQACESMLMRAEEYRSQNHDRTYTCNCIRTFKIDKDGVNAVEQ